MIRTIKNKRCMVMARKKIIAGNWKMNMTPSQAVELINTLKPLVANDEVDVLLCVPTSCPLWRQQKVPIS